MNAGINLYWYEYYYDRFSGPFSSGSVESESLEDAMFAVEDLLGLSGGWGEWEVKTVDIEHLKDPYIFGIRHKGNNYVKVKVLKQEVK